MPWRLIGDMIFLFIRILVDLFQREFQSEKFVKSASEHGWSRVVIAIHVLLLKLEQNFVVLFRKGLLIGRRQNMVSTDTDRI